MTSPFKQLAAIFIAMAMGPTAVLHGQQQEAMLYWNNGDSLPGRLVSLDDTSLVWRSSLFADDVQLNLDVLDSIQFPVEGEAVDSGSDFSVQLKNGDLIYGNLEAVNQTSVILESSRHGRIELDRDHVSSISDLRKSRVVLAGIGDLSEWGSLKGKGKHWTLDPEGNLRSTRPRINIFRKMKLPETVQIDLLLTWETRLNFLIGFAVPNSTNGIDDLSRIETWDDSLVLVDREGEFEILYESLATESRRLQLSILLDTGTKQVKVFDETGRLIGEQALPPLTNGMSKGIFLNNRKGDLVVETLRIHENASGFDPAVAGIQTAVGEMIRGNIADFDGKTWTIRDRGESRQIEAGNLRTALFRSVERSGQDSDHALVRYRDGSSLRGKFVAVLNDRLSLQTSYSKTPVLCELAGVASLRPGGIAHGDPISIHVLELPDMSLRGELVPGSELPDDVLRWNLAGSTAPVRIAFTDGRFSLRNQVVDGPPGATWPDSLYLTNRDVIPCQVTRIDDTRVYFNSLGERSSVLQSVVKAIDFASAVHDEAVSTMDDDWHLSKAAKQHAVRDDNRISLNGSQGHIGHPQLMSGRHVQFDLAWNGQSFIVLEVQMFVANVSKPIGGAKFTFTLSDKYLGLGESGHDVFSDGQAQLELSKNRATVTIRVVDQTLEILVNGKRAGRFALPKDKINGRGLVFHSRPLGGNPNLLLSNFHVISSDDPTPLVNENDKERVLTIPRFRQANPPKQILCSRNGDLLRGKLIRLEGQRIVFQSRLEEFVFPRSVVASLVWLHADSTGETPEQNSEQGGELEASLTTSPDSSAADAGGSLQRVQVVLDARRRITITAESWDKGVLRGNSDSLGSCRVPFREISEIRLGSFAVQANDTPYSDWVAVAAKEVQLDGSSATGVGDSSSLIGQAADEFEVPLLDGGTASLAGLRGKIVVLDFWATWCAPCVRSLPEIDHLVREFGPEKVQLIALNQGETEEHIRKFLEQRGWSMPVGLDSDEHIAEHFNVSNLPQTVVIDGDGKIAFLQVGTSPDLRDKLRNTIQSILDSRNVN